MRPWRHAPGWPLRGATALAVVVVVVVASLIVWTALRRLPATALVQSLPAPAPPSRPARNATVQATVAVAAQPAVAAAVPAAAAASAAAGKEMLDVCGVGRVELQAVGEMQSSPLHGPALATAELPPHLGAHAYATAREHLLATLRAGPPRQQAAALLLGPDPAAEPSALPPDPEQAQQAQQVQQALLSLARSTHDGAIWRWAMAVCSNSPATCTGVQPGDWAEADGGNAVAWLHLLQTDPQASQDAWRGLAQATRATWYHGALTATALQAWPADAPRHLIPALMTETIGLEAALPWPAFNTVAQACRRPALEDTRRLQCNALIQALVHGSDTVLAFAIGLRMADAAGWPAGPLQALSAEREALKHAPGFALSLQPYSCDSVDHLQAFALQIGEQGELAAMRRQLADARAETRSPAAARPSVSPATAPVVR